MCTYSMVVDHYSDIWPRRYPQGPGDGYIPGWKPQRTPEQIKSDNEEAQETYKRVMEQLEKKFPKTEPISDAEIQEFRELLERAREYNLKNNEPACEEGAKKSKLIHVLNDMGVSKEKIAVIQSILDE